MATKLKNLKIRKVDFVDEGANPDAHIALTKRREEPEAQGDPAQEPEKKGLGDRFLSFFKRMMAQGNDLEATLEAIEKGNHVSFGEAVTNRHMGKITDEIWTICFALYDSLCSIAFDPDMDTDAKFSGMNDSVVEFSDYMTQFIESWKSGSPVNLVMKDTGYSPDDLEIIKSAGNSLFQVITKSIPGVSPETENTMSKGEEKEMKIDKSKMTPAEKAMLEEFEKRYGTEDGTGDPETPAAQVTPHAQDGVEKTAQVPAAAPAPAGASASAQADDGDIYKGMSPAAKAQFESLVKFRQEAEDREIREVAKRYTLIGKKEDELFPVLKSLKATSEDAYNQMVSTLDEAKAAVEKSGAFNEIGKSGNGQVTPDDPWTEADRRAVDLMKNKSGMTKAQALQEVFEADPELAKKCKEV